MNRLYHQYELSTREKVGFVAGFLGFLALCSYLFYNNLILILLLPLLYEKGKALFQAHCIDKRKTRLLQEFRDFLFSLSTSFSTGRSLSQGIHEAREYLMEIYGQDGFMTEELVYMEKAMEETGKSERDVFADFAGRSGLEDVRTFAQVYQACRESGGDLVTAVNKAARTLSEKIQLELEIKTLLSQKRLEGRMIALMPFVMIAFLLLMSPDYLQTLYTTMSGRCVMTVALALNVFGFIWMERMTNVEV